VSNAERIQADGERKQVTVLFADVKGSMDLAEQQDPEQWRRIMQGFFTILADEVHRFEGTVDKFTGDGIMAVFGAPIAYEDHARRACYAALRMLDDISEYAAELRRKHGLSFSTRIGINSGEVVAGAIGAEGDSEYTAIGHTVGLAQRMEALAEPGKAYLTEAAAELVRGFFELEDLGEFEIKGASRPVRVLELAGVGSARSRLDLSRERGFSRFVGREEEMGVLAAALEMAGQGDGGAVGVVAEPGVGKSRLCHEFAERARREGIDVYEAQAQAHGRETPFMPILQLLRSYFGILDSDPERIVREKIAGRVLLLDSGFVDDLPLLFDFLGVPDPDRPLPQLSAEARQRALQGLVCRLVQAPNRREPIVAVIEDLHWLDEPSKALLGELLAAVTGTKTLVLVNYRPEGIPAEATEHGGGYSQIVLEPLGPSDTRELLRDLAGEDPSLDGLADLIHERTAGNPFFIEEIVRALVEAGNLEGERGAYRLVRPVEDTGVPATVQAVLAARIDRLDPAAKMLLQAASVAGKEVPERTLARIAVANPKAIEEQLAELIDAGFLFDAELYPERILAFRHPLTREVAYGSQLAEQRRPLHTATAWALVEANPDRHEELAALIAHHLQEGGETREAARWSARAAFWAGHSQPREAQRLWRTVMELAAELDEDEESAALSVASRLQLLDLAWRLGMNPEEEGRLKAEAEEIATRSGDLRALTLLRMSEARPGQPHRAEEWIEAGKASNRIADESGDVHLQVAVRGACAYAYLCAGDFDAFERELDKTLELAGNDPSVGAGIVVGCPVAWAYSGKGLIRRERGEPEAAEELLSRALRIATEQGDPETASWTRSNLASLHALRGDVETGLAMARRNCELTEQLGDVFSRTLAIANLGWVQLKAGECAAALESFESAERIYREAMGNGGEMESWRASLRAEALTGVGRLEDAMELAEGAAAVAHERGMRWAVPGCLLALGRARAAAGQEGAREALEEAAAAASETGAMMLLAGAEEELAALGAAAR
jgi:class 3 adenylate cyclase/tetratricopeptide (TPR) repeat protein